MFRRVDAYGVYNVVVSSSAWFEMEQTIKRYAYRYYVMLSNGQLLNIDELTRDHEFDDERRIVKISNDNYTSQ